MHPTPALKASSALLLTCGALGTFHLGFLFPAFWWLVLVHVGCLFELRRLPTARAAFYVGLAIGLGVFGPQMGFLWEIFKGAAIPLWLVLALFYAAFLLLLNRVESRWGTFRAGLLMPVLWCGIEYLRSEVWWLRFAWFTAGECLPPESTPRVLHRLGIYGLGFGLAWAAGQGATWVFATRRNDRMRAGLGFLAACMGFAALALWPLPRSNRDIPKTIQVAGLQLEFPSLPDILAGLDALIRSHPEAELLMLSEYSLEEPPPKALKAWCRRNGKWLVVGGKQPIGSGDSDGLGSTPSASSHTNAAVVGQVAAGNGLRWPRSGAPKERFHNTAFVISPNGAVVFQQAKSRPIQFFADGEPAPSQAVWDSPWGKLGIAICYDASYRQVMDPLIRLGATGLLIPTMDVEHWGEHEHRLNARMAVIRASEYRVPIFRVASSGISQLINPNGRETVTAPFPGPGHALAGPLTLAGSAPSVPLDAWLAPACTAATAAVILWLAIASRRKSQISDTAQDSRPDLPALDSSL